MEKKIKLIWDFRGPTAKKTAEHHTIHLKEYIESEELKFNITAVRDRLKPHRGELYND